MTDILIVDDSHELAELLGMVLEAEGFSVGMAHSGRQALRWLRRAKAAPRALLLDMWMPDMDGPELIAQLARLPQWRDLPIIGMTAEYPVSERVRTLPVSSLLLKPFSLDDVVNAFQKAIGAEATAA